MTYHYKSGSTDGTVFRNVILEIIQRPTDTGLHVIAVTSDMGSANRAMWKSFDVVCGKHCRPQTRVRQPQDPEGCCTSWQMFHISSRTSKQLLSVAQTWQEAPKSAGARTLHPPQVARWCCPQTTVGRSSTLASVGCSSHTRDYYE